LSISEEFARLFGYTVAEFLEGYKSIDRDLELVHPDDRKMVRKTYSSNKNINVNYRILRKDASIRYVREIFEVTFDEASNPVESDHLGQFDLSDSALR